MDIRGNFECVRDELEALECDYAEAKAELGFSLS